MTAEPQVEVKFKVRWLRPKEDDEIFAIAYMKMKQEKTLQLLFWEESPSLRAFLDWCSQPNSIVAGVFTDGPTLELAGIGALHSINMRGGKKRADTSEIFWRKYWITQHTLEMGKMLLNFAFEDAEMEILYGITPEPNRAAVDFMVRCGFDRFGPVPGLCSWHGRSCPGWLSVMSREKWLQGGSTYDVSPI
jgi:RimJ/RimL family protein N-acetyltransferase